MDFKNSKLLKLSHTGYTFKGGYFSTVDFENGCPRPFTRCPPTGGKNVEF